MLEAAPGVWILEGTFVNAYLVEGRAGECVLVDSGFSYWRASIEAGLRVLEGRGHRLAAVFLTHGHADHSGCARFFSERYRVPIYVHRLELPFLDGSSSYPPPDASIGGPHAFISRLVDERPRDLGGRLMALDFGQAWCASEGQVPELPEWRWIHTPGHSPGHVALFRERDRVLIAGDALGSANFDRWRNMLRREPGVWRGESPYICNWSQARNSVRLLAMLQPETLLCGHGPVLHGRAVAQQLGAFAANYPVPSEGRYVETGARYDDTGTFQVPPARHSSRAWVGPAIVLGAVIAARAGVTARRRSARLP